MFDVHVPADRSRWESVEAVGPFRTDADHARERVEGDLDPVDEVSHVPFEIPDVDARFVEVLGKETQPHLAGEKDVVSPSLVLKVEHPVLDFPFGTGDLLPRFLPVRGVVFLPVERPLRPRVSVVLVVQVERID